MKKKKSFLWSVGSWYVNGRSFQRHTEDYMDAFMIGSVRASTNASMKVVEDSVEAGSTDVHGGKLCWSFRRSSGYFHGSATFNCIDYSLSTYSRKLPILPRKLQLLAWKLPWEMWKTLSMTIVEAAVEVYHGSIREEMEASRWYRCCCHFSQALLHVEPSIASMYFHGSFH